MALIFLWIKLHYSFRDCLVKFSELMIHFKSIPLFWCILNLTENVYIISITYTWRKTYDYRYY